MSAIIIFVVLTLFEIGFGAAILLKKSRFKREKSIGRIVLFSIFLLLVASPIFDWSFRWTMLAFVLGVQAFLGIVALICSKENVVPKKSRVVFACLSQILLAGMAVMPAIILPQYDEIMPTGNYSVGTISYTLTDESREEYFTEEKDNRKVSIQYWFPSERSGQEETVAKGKFPLVIFSHGAFGYRMSNYSTYQELASHGYIVCSIDHTYHAFMTKQEDGKTIIANMEFMNDAMKAQSGQLNADEVYELEQEWMKLRTDDMAFVLDYIKQRTVSGNRNELYKSMDLEHIGVFGHSMGGATAAQIGRVDEGVDAVVVVDGTMMGEITGFKNGKELVTDKPYPKPIMNIYNESHYIEALAAQDSYPNMVAYSNAQDSYQLVVEGSGHMNFTDLAIISPILSRMLETGDASAIDVDARYCIEATNEAILQFFDRYLKSNNIDIPKKRFL